ncbi:hypothetical protein ACKC9G_11555 [Pokkaliibacter sp. CJK22405]|uniref:hypothetical protein n=1 Tax=Pokkaliibacter sp. CJK22405 TaxID=3384615 RepID=UPI003984C711
MVSIVKSHTCQALIDTSPARQRLSSLANRLVASRPAARMYAVGEQILDRVASHQQSRLMLIGYLSASAKVRELTPLEKDLTKSFVLESHLRAISSACESGKMILTVRQAGEPTLTKLARGAAAKGHDIDDKTIKFTSMTDTYGEQIGLLRLAAMRFHDIEGCVGRWSQDSLEGIYLCLPKVRPDESEALHQLRAQTYDYTTAHGTTYPILRVDPDNLQSSLAPLKALGDDWERYVYTGDYDLHDLIGTKPRPHIISSESPDEDFSVNALNVSVAAIDDDRAFAKDSHHVFQHGSQYNYPAHMGAEEHGAMLNAGTAHPSFPLAACVEGKWERIENVQQLEKLYERYKLTLKATWKLGSTTRFVDHEKDDGTDLQRGPNRKDSIADGRKGSVSSTFPDRRASLLSISSRHSTSSRGSASHSPIRQQTLPLPTKPSLGKITPNALKTEE